MPTKTKKENSKSKSKSEAKANSKPDSPKASPREEALLAKEITTLTKEVRKLKKLEFLQVFKHPGKFMLFSFIKGLLVGFGSVVGASVVVAIVVYILSQITFVPIIGDFVEDIIQQISFEQPSQS